MRVSKEEQIRLCFVPGIDSGLVTLLYRPVVSVGEKNFLARYLNQFNGGLHSKAVAVARYSDKCQLGIDMGDLTCVTGHIAQMEHGVRLMGFDGGNHLGGAMMGIRKNQ